MTKEKINWELENLRAYIESKGYKYLHNVGSLTYTAYVYQSKMNGKRIEIWDDQSGELLIADMAGKPLKLEDL